MHSERLYFAVSAERLKTYEEAVADAEKFSSIRDQVVCKAVKAFKHKQQGNSDIDKLL